MVINKSQKANRLEDELQIQVSRQLSNRDTPGAHLRLHFADLIDRREHADEHVARARLCALEEVVHAAFDVFAECARRQVCERK